MKRMYLVAALCLTALLAAGCAAAPEPVPVEPSVIPTDPPTEAPAATETEEETEEGTGETSDAEAAESLAPWEQELRDKEWQAKQEVESERYAAQYQEKHRLYKERGGALVKGAASWQAAYAKVLTSGEARYLADEPLKDDAFMSYYLLHIEDSDSPNLVVRIPTDDNGSCAVLIFRYTDGNVTYLSSSNVNEWDGLFFYRPYRGDVGNTEDLMMSKMVYTVIRHLGEKNTYSFLNTVFDTDEHQLTNEEAARFDIIIDEDAELGNTGKLGNSWASVSVGHFRPITPDTIALLYSED